MSSTAKRKRSEGHTTASELFDKLDDFATGAYCLFPGSYCDEMAALKLLPSDQRALVWFGHSQILDPSEAGACDEGARCVVLTTALPHVYIAAFRGSDLGREPKAGKETAPANAGDVKACHELLDEGMPWAANVFAQQLDSFVKSSMDKFGPNAKFIFTGHSLGGALALIAAKKHAAITKKHANSMAIAYGTPPIKGGWADALAETLGRTVNFMDQLDPFLCVYNNTKVYGNEKSCTKWLTVVPKFLDGQQFIRQMYIEKLSEHIERNLKKQVVDLVNGDLIQELTNGVRNPIDNYVEETHFAGTYMKSMERIAPKLKERGVSLLERMAEIPIEIDESSSFQD